MANKLICPNCGHEVLQSTYPFADQDELECPNENCRAVITLTLEWELPEKEEEEEAEDATEEGV